MTDVGELVVRIRADAAQLEQEMRKANGIVKQNTNEMGGAFGRLKSEILSLAPALSALALVQFGKNAVNAAGHINDLADRIGFAADTLSDLEIPLATSGSNLDEFSAAVNRMNNLVGEAAKGNEEAVKAFDALGLSVKKLRTLTPEQQFYEIASALGKIKDQSTQTEAGMNIFGRGFAALLPLLKQYEGDMRKAIKAQEDMKNGLSSDAIQRVDDFGDSLSAAGIRIRNVFIEALAAILKVNDAINTVLAKPATNAKAGLPGDNSALRYGPNLPKGTVSSDRPNSVDFAVFRGAEQYGPNLPSTDARGDNKALLGAKEAAQAAKDRAKQIEDATRALGDYNRSLEEEGELLGMSERAAAAQEARFKVEEIARKGNITLTHEEIEASAELAAKNYDLKKAQDEVNKSIAEAARFQQELHDKLSATLTDIVFKAGSAKEAMLGFAESIAKAAFEKRIAGPLADSLLGTGGSGGLLDGVFGAGGLFGGFFADGGSPPVGKVSVVGENGPEIFVPNTAGTIIPNGAVGGTTVIVQQTINLSPGLPETVNAAIRNAAPQIAAQAQAAVFAEMKRGGPASRITGLRN